MNTCVIKMSREILEMFLKGSDTPFTTNAPLDMRVVGMREEIGIYKPRTFVVFAESSEFPCTAEGGDYPIFDLVVTRTIEAMNE